MQPIKVILGGEEFLVKRKLPGQRVFTECLTEELNYKFSAECPRLGRNEKSIILIHVGALFSQETQSTPMKPFFQRFKANSTPVRARLRGLEMSLFLRGESAKLKLLDYGSNQVTTSSRC